MIPLLDAPKNSSNKDLCQGEGDGTAHGTAPGAVESASEHVFILAVPPHLVDAAGELVAALVEAASDPTRRTRLPSWAEGRAFRGYGDYAIRRGRALAGDWPAEGETPAAAVARAGAAVGSVLTPAPGRAGRPCPSCGEGQLAPRRRMCDSCRVAWRRATWRDSKRHSRGA